MRTIFIEIIEMMYRPRNELVLVKLFKKYEKATAAGLIIPEETRDNGLIRSEVVAVGSKVTDLVKGDIVWSEQVHQKIVGQDEDIVLVNEKYIHVVEEK